LTITLIVALAGLSSCSQSAPDPRLLYRVEWEVATIKGPDGVVHRTPKGWFQALRFDGNGHYSTNGCNFGGGSVEIDGARLDSDRGPQTLRDCSGEFGALDNLMGQLFESRPRWSVAANMLRLEGGHIVANLVRRVPVWPDRGLHVQMEMNDSTHGPQFQLGWTGSRHIYLSFQGRDKPGDQWQFSDRTVDKRSVNLPGFDAATVTVGGRGIAFAGLASNTRSAEFWSGQHKLATLTIFNLPDSRKACVGFVPTGRRGHIVARDVSGRAFNSQSLLANG